MAINEEIARLTGTLAFKVDLTGLHSFEAKLAGVEAKLKQFSSLANQKFNIKVQLDAVGLKASLDKAAATKIRFNNVSLSKEAMERVSTSVIEKFARTPILLKNVKIDVSSVMAQRAEMRSKLENVSVATKLVLRMNEAEAKLRAWKKNAEARYKLHINADISRAKLLANARKTLQAVGQSLGTFTVTSPKIKLTVDRAALRAEIAAVLQQIKHEAKINISLNGHVTGGGRGVSGIGSHAGAGIAGGLVGGGMGFMRGLVPGLGAAYAVSKLNEINQQMQGQDLALTAVTGSKEAGAAAKARLRAMADDIGFNARELTPAFTKMIASGEASGFGQEKSEKVFKAMAEYGRVMGLDSEAMKGSMRAVEQMMNKGQIMSEELKGQLGERFPAAIALFAKSQKMSIPELFKAMEKGLVKSDALEAFAVTLAEEARKGGALDGSKQSTAAQQARMGNYISDSIQSFSEGGFDYATARFFKTVADALKEMQPLIRSLGQAFEVLMAPINAFIKILGEIGSMWPSLAQGLGLTSGQFSALATVLTIFLLPLGEVVLGLGALVLAIEDIIAFSKGEDSIFGKLLDGLSDERLTNLFVLGQAFIEAKDAVVEMSKALGELFGLMNKEANVDVFKKGLGMYFDLIVEKATNALNLIKNIASTISNLAKGDFAAAGEDLKNYGANLVHGGPVQWLMRPDLRDAVDQRYDAQRAAQAGRVNERLQNNRDDKQRGEALMQTAGQAAQQQGATFTGDVHLHFPNAKGDTTDIEKAVGRVMDHTRKMLNQTNADLSEAQ